MAPANVCFQHCKFMCLVLEAPSRVPKLSATSMHDPLIGEQVSPVVSTLLYTNVFGHVYSRLRPFSSLSVPVCAWYLSAVSEHLWPISAHSVPTRGHHHTRHLRRGHPLPPATTMSDSGPRRRRRQWPPPGGSTFLDFLSVPVLRCTL